TDAGIDNAPHYAYAAALEALAGIGVPVAEVLDAATSVGARSMGLDDRIGSLEPGKSADLIGAAGDPLLDLSCLRKPELVVVAGVPFVPDPFPDLADATTSIPDEETVFAHDH